MSATSVTPTTTGAVERFFTSVLLCVLTGLRDHVDQVRLTAFHRVDAALERRRQFRRIGNRSFTGHTVRRGHLGVVDVRISESCADVSPVGSASADAGHVLYEHQLLMPRAVVVHDGEYRELVMHRGP